MNEEGFEKASRDEVRRVLTEAEEAGVGRPIILWVLSTLDPATRSIFAEVRGQEMEPPRPGPEYGLLAWSSKETALRLLRTHGGARGACAAAHLADKRFDVDVWHLNYFRDRLRFHGLNREKMGSCCEGLALQDGIGRLVSPPESNDDVGPARTLVGLDDGRAVPVFGRTKGDAEGAADVFSIAWNRRVWLLPDSDREEAASMPVDDDVLVSILTGVRDPGLPHQVSEAVQALRKAGGGKDRWLLEIIDTRRELRDLARKVRTELTGESA